jgi:hypothetical protein
VADYIDDEFKRKFQTLWDWFRNLRGPGWTNTPNGPSFHVPAPRPAPPAQPAKPLVTLKVTGFSSPVALNPGVYYAKSVTGTAAPLQAQITGGTTTEPLEGETVSATNDYILINRPELSRGTHELNDGGEQPTVEANPKGAVEISGTTYKVATAVVVLPYNC